MPAIKTPTKSVTGPQVFIQPYDDVRPGVGPLDIHVPGNWYCKVRTMRRDPTISMVRQLVIAPALLAPWAYEKTEDAPDGADKYIEQQIGPLRSYMIRQTLFGCIDFGWQAFEKIFSVDKDSMQINLDKMKPLLQDWTEILVDTKTGAYMGLRQVCNKTGAYVYVPLEQSFLHSFDVEGTYWYGKGMMENAEMPYDYWNTVNTSNNRYDEKLAGSHWVVHYPVGVSVRNGAETNNEVIALEILRTLQSSGGIAVPKALEQFISDMNEKTPNAWEIEIIDSKGGQVGFVERMNYLDKLKVRAFGFPERSILEGQFGTKAEAEAHADFAIANVLLRTEDLVRDLNWHLVNQLIRINYGKEYENTVYIKSGSIGEKNRKFLMEIYKQLLSNPEGFTAEFDNIDRESMRDLLEVPTDEQSEAEDELLSQA